MIYGNNLRFNHTRRGDIVVDKKDASMGFGIYIKYSESTILFSGELEMTSVKNDNVNYKPIMNIPDNKRMTLIIYNQNDYLNMRDKASLIQTGTRTYERKQFYPVYALDNNLLHLILAFVGKYMGIKKVIKRLTVSENMNLL